MDRSAPRSGSASARGRGYRTVILVTTLVVLGSSFSPARASDDVNITMSYFRYCLEEVCTPDQFAYVRVRQPPGPHGPALPPAADNPRGMIEVRPGDRIVWTNNDALCDFNDGPGGGPSPIFCPGHNVLFEDGSVKSPLIEARTHPSKTFSWTVPTTTPPGSIIRYYCEPTPGNSHYEIGMTGILRIV